MSWRAQSRSKDAKTPSVAGVRLIKPEPGCCPVQPYHTKCTKKCGLRTSCNAVLKELGPKTLNWIVARSSHTPQMPKRRDLAFGITPNTQHTAGTTSPRATPWEFAGVVWEVACSSEKPEWAHDTAKNGGQRRERPLGRRWWPLPWHVASSGRALLPAVRHPTKPAKSSDAKKSIYAETQSIFTPLTLLRFGWGFQGALGPGKCHVIRSECHDMKGKIVGHYIGHNSPPAPPGGSKRI